MRWYENIEKSAFIPENKLKMVSDFYTKSKRLKIYKIINKDWESVWFQRNKTQEFLEKKKKELKEKYGRVRLIVLKWRQLGITTNEVISGLDTAVMRANQNIGILAQVDKTREEIFDKVKYAYQNLPKAVRLSDWKMRYKPTTKYSTKKDLEFTENHSKLAVISDSRRWTRTKLHISEFAFINNADELLAWTLPSVPKDWDIIIESTANWFWNAYEQLRTKYWWKWDNYDWTCVFLGWWLADEYSLPLEKWVEKVQLPKELSFLDKPMVDWTMLSEEQKNWYLHMYNSQINPEFAFQEYPCTPDDAFIHTWTPVFSNKELKDLIVPQYTEDIEIPWLRIYGESRAWQCVYWWDTSAGVENGDYSCIIVRDLETCDLLACYYGLCEPAYLCKVISRLVDLWYWWRIWVERNNTWFAFYERAKEYPRYSMLFQTNVVGTVNDHITIQIGWDTNSKTRPILMEDYKEAIKKLYISQVDERLLWELHTFIYDEKMKEVAQEWHHDDAVMTDSICYQMRKFPL